MLFYKLGLGASDHLERVSFTCRRHVGFSWGATVEKAFQWWSSASQFPSLGFERQSRPYQDLSSLPFDELSFCC